ncbi:PaaI family thioesterase [Neiella marina]|uniref:Acyl-coenzyme A thioesterase THEM4 n=1 Tax=Neiella holothuriorum TaxID=2870530 RepID=A0ABS7EJZ9_9GAMM|nr:PaaI family thioesterase [Neiella holothuriorum]MBW8192545.1 PaaI family thioesterase [Neiella holothuriorum]
MSLPHRSPVPAIAAADVHPHCFACSDLPSGLGLTFDSVASNPEVSNKVVARFFTHDLFQGYPQRLHGGITCTLLDAAMTHCLFTAGIAALTADLNVRFMAPVPLNEHVEIEAQLLTTKRGVYQLEAKLWRNKQCLAKATGKFLRSKSP